MKRATKIPKINLKDEDISIHALVKRATTVLYGRQPCKIYFNPRPREEGDVKDNEASVKGTVISIHALVKRATL